jgi:uncharacterized protein (DUF1800 family)
MKPTTIAQLQSGLTPYSGVWSDAQVLHLLRRTMFGASLSDVTYFKTRTMQQAVTELLTVDNVPPVGPVNNYNNAVNTDPNVASGAVWTSAMNISDFGSGRRQSLRAWWAGQMLNQTRSIREKMVVFWHNHFAAGFESVGIAHHCYTYNTLFRSNSLSNFKTLTRAVTLSPAMLYFLNGRRNTKNAPDENYARELQELFTIGKDLADHYTEDDVKAAARVLTGWRVNTTTGAVYFDATRHDATNKQFSNFYGNTVITGSSAATAGDTELDALLTMLFANDEVANYICRKIYRFFVYYTITPNIETNVIQPLAAIFRQNNYAIQPVLEALFQSQHFYDVQEISCMIKSPLDFTIGYARQFGLQFPTASNYDVQYYMWEQVMGACFVQQGLPSDPPNVAGFPAYYQSPNYHEAWITPDSLRQRKAIAEGLIAAGITRQGIKLQVDVLAFTQTIPNAGDPNLLLDNAVLLLLGLNVSTITKATMKQILLGFQAQDHYWTDAWNTYLTDPANTANTTSVTQRLQYVYASLLGLAEYQLA